ncbi:MAG: hypothetical protein ACFFCQ_11190 [Promethearchaeota archaeon]
MSVSITAKLKEFFIDIIKTSTTVRGGICTSDGLPYFSTAIGAQSEQLDDIISLLVVGVAENAIRYGLLEEASLQFSDAEIYVLAIPDRPQFYAYLVFTSKKVPTEFFKQLLYDRRLKLSYLL